jgi:hypothetical protein
MTFILLCVQLYAPASNAAMGKLPILGIANAYITIAEEQATEVAEHTLKSYSASTESKKMRAP